MSHSNERHVVQFLLSGLVQMIYKHI